MPIGLSDHGHGFFLVLERVTVPGLIFRILCLSFYHSLGLTL